MITVYTFLWIIVASYFFFKKRKIDMYSVVFLSSSYYSYPLFLGFLYDLENHIYPDIDNRIYFYYMVYFLSLLAGTWWSDQRPINQVRNLNPIPYEWLFLSLIFLGAILFFYPGFFSPVDIDTPTRPSLLGPIYPLYVWTSLGLFWLALFSKSRFLPWVGAFFIILTAFAAGRSFVGALIFSIAVAGSIQVTGRQVKKYSPLKYFIFLGGALVLMLLYKLVYSHFLVFDLQNAQAAITDMNQIRYRLVEGSEPNIVMLNFQNSLSPVLDSHSEYTIFFFFGSIPFLSNHFLDAMGYTNLTFSDVLKENSYTSVEYGMASTLIGEIYYIGGYVLVLLFIFIFNVTLYMANRYIYKYGSWASPALIFVFYYYHRLEVKSLAYVLSITLVCAALAAILRGLLHFRTNKKSLGIKSNVN